MPNKEITIPGFYPLDDADIEIVKKVASEQLRKIKTIIPNRVLQDDIFSVLKPIADARVFYAPFGSDTNVYAFHLNREISGVSTNLIFINTSKSLSDQVFAVAHELGHCLKVEKKIRKKEPEIDYIEGVMNRFASELLMPEDEFRKTFENLLDLSKETFSVSDFFVPVVSLMAKFCVPMKAVILRIAEIKLISYKGAKYLIEYFQTNNKALESYIIAAGYKEKLIDATNRKQYSDLAQLVKDLLDEEKISRNHAESVFNVLGISLTQYEKGSEKQTMEVLK